MAMSKRFSNKIAKKLQFKKKSEILLGQSFPKLLQLFVLLGQHIAQVFVSRSFAKLLFELPFSHFELFLRRKHTVIVVNLMRCLQIMKPLHLRPPKRHTCTLSKVCFDVVRSSYKALFSDDLSDILESNSVLRLLNWPSRSLTREGS